MLVLRHVLKLRIQCISKTADKVTVIMDYSEIIEEVKSGEYALSKFDGKSQCWKLFEKILNSDSEEIFGLVCCSKSLSCIMHKTRNPDGKVIDYGTKNLFGHMKHCNLAATGNTAGTVKSYFQPSIKIDQRMANSIKVAESKLVVHVIYLSMLLTTQILEVSLKQ